MSLSMPSISPPLLDNIQRLLKGEEVEIPKFSFETGQRYYDGEKLKIARNNVIIVEGIMG